MKSVTVLICVIFKKTKLGELNFYVDSTFGALGGGNPKSFELVSRLPSFTRAPLGEVARSCDPQEDLGYHILTEALAAILCFFFIILMFAVVDLENVSSGSNSTLKQKNMAMRTNGINQAQRSSLVQVVFVPRTKVSPTPRVDSVASIKPSKSINHLSTLEEEKLAEKLQRNKSSKFGVHGSSGAFSFRSGFLTKKRRASGPSLKGNKKVTSERTEREESSLLGSLDLRVPPRLVDQGNVSLVYSLFNKQGEEAGIFKPYEATFNLSQVTNLTEQTERENRLTMNSQRHALSEVCAYAFDQLTDVRGRAGVPQTQMVKFPAKMFGTDAVTELGYVKGSFQKFVKDSESCEDYGSSLFSTDDIHKIGILDVKILNCDRHTGNMLVKSVGKTKKLIPIDHALSFPEFEFDLLESKKVVDPALEKDLNNFNVADVSFDWMLFPQAKKPFSKPILESIRKIDVVEHLQKMNESKMSVKQRLAVFMSLMILTRAALKYSKTLHEIGGMVQRTGDRTAPSVLEQLARQSFGNVDKDSLLRGDEVQTKLFCSNFTDSLEAYLELQRL